MNEKEKGKKRGTLSLIKDMLRQARPYWKYMGITVFSVVMVSALQLAGPMIIRKIIALITDYSSGTGPSAEALVRSCVLLGTALAAVYLCASVFQGCRSYFAHRAAWYFVSDMRIRIYRHIQELSLGFFHNRQTGQLLSRVVNDPATLEMLIAHVVPDIIVNLALLLGVIFLLFVMNPILAGISMAFLPLIFYSIYQYAFLVRPMFKKSQQVLSELNGVVAENLNGMREIQAFNQQEKETGRVADSSRIYTVKVMDALTKGAIYHPRIEFLNNLATAAVLVSGGLLAAAGKVQVADIIAFMLYLGLLQGPVSAMGRLNEDLQTSMAGIERCEELLSIHSNVKEAEHPLEDVKLRGEVAFDRVSFSYIEDSDVLRDVSFTVAPGRMVAIVGPTGAGKSTIANLLMRFYDCDQGAVMLDGRNIREYRLKDIRNGVSIVMQDIFLFNGTVADNIAYGVKNASPEQIRKAAQMARAEDFILEMPQGYETLIGERGVKLSGGQKQRISIARALLRNMPILILDEATAAVDMNTEKKIQSAIQEVTRDRSTIVIAHRLSTVMNADEILYLDNGTILERGTHRQLLEKNGYYAALWRQAMVVGG